MRRPSFLQRESRLDVDPLLAAPLKQNLTGGGFRKDTLNRASATSELPGQVNDGPLHAADARTGRQKENPRAVLCFHRPLSLLSEVTHILFRWEAPDRSHIADGCSTLANHDRCSMNTVTFIGCVWLYTGTFAGQPCM